MRQIVGGLDIDHNKSHETSRNKKSKQIYCKLFRILFLHSSAPDENGSNSALKAHVWSSKKASVSRVEPDGLMTKPTTLGALASVHFDVIVQK